jgi:hypothetical protein
MVVERRTEAMEGEMPPSRGRANAGVVASLVAPAAAHGDVGCRNFSARVGVDSGAWPNVGDQRLATAGLAAPQDSIASPLHRVVLRPLSHRRRSDALFALRKAFGLFAAREAP